MSAEGGGGVVGIRLALDVVAVGLHIPGLALIGEHDIEDLFEAILQGGFEDRGDALDAAIEVSVHPIG